MAKAKSTKSAKKNKRQGRKNSRPTKKEREHKKAVRKMVVAFLTAFILFFAIIRLGVFGITAYNLIRLAVGSLAYPAIFGVLFYLFAGKWLQKHAGFMSGYISAMAGLMLIFHAYFFSMDVMKKRDIFEGTFRLATADLKNVDVTHFLGGGMVGAVLYKPVVFLFSNIGSYLIGGLFIVLGLYLMSSWDVYDVMRFFKKTGSSLSDKIDQTSLQMESRREQKRQAKVQAKAQAAKEQEASQPEKDDDFAGLIDPETGEILSSDLAQSTPKTEPEILGGYDEEVQDSYSQQDFKNYHFHYPDEEEAENPASASAQAASSNLDQTQDQEDDDEPVQVDFTPKQHLLYKLPTIDLFAPDKPKNQTKEKKIVRQNIKILEETFASFGIKASVERAEIGPSVTKYEIKPAVGVRVNRISNLADDLALALAAKDVRIEAPIPGKSLVGIEVPNSEIATVTFRELWEQAKTNPSKLLEVPLGKAVNGTARSFDLARMPHLLVAGSTGSGKSVAVNGIIASILMKARPDQVKFMMIDPKMVELSVYNDIPHLLIPVVTNPRKAAKALQKVVDEMENRYELFSHVGVRNIAGYNAKVESFNAQSEEKKIPLPLIVVIVDELADLMMVASKEVEDAIIRLGQKARAAGIHMILATQRPSVDVISGLIKANVPSRIAFAVSSGTDSRTILDENGAEKLLGRGDMLFKPIDENHPIRLQGSFISDDDVERIVDFIKDQAEADYDHSFDPGEVSENDGDSGSGSGASEGDPLFAEARALVLETQKASASMLQRRLSVGFNRATRLMEELEEAGVIGPAEGTKPRKVLITNQ
ncbi:DNA translocase FtsK [Streptococcus tangpeifui]|uniref:FtsK/SpoIIIE family DNA translocase n=1 Tax=Streptococcus tangpeifui TaxID=2709400 RepID=UPI0013EACBD9|nr:MULTISPECIES: DNA translocase FtsK [unclassified Streptococcus]